MGVSTSMQCSAEVERLVRNNMGLAYHQLKKWNRSYDTEALSAALEGLWKAAMTYDASKKVQFSTYASVCIYNAIGMYMRKEKRVRDREVTSIDAPIYETLTLADTIADSHTPESDYINAELISSMHKSYAKVLAATRSERQRTVMELWYNSGGSMNQQAIADTIGGSQSYVSRIIAATKHKIRKEMEAYL